MRNVQVGWKTKVNHVLKVAAINICTFQLNTLCEFLLLELHLSLQLRFIFLEVIQRLKVRYSETSY